MSLLFDIGELHRGSLRAGEAHRRLRARHRRAARPAALGHPVRRRRQPASANRGRCSTARTAVGKNGELFRILQVPQHARRARATAPTEWTTARRSAHHAVRAACCDVAHLDELPQLINILKGDLSVVGPRPEQPHYVRSCTDKLPFYTCRHLVRPGLTGWAQVKYGYAGDEKDALEKLQYEFYYLRHQSLASTPASSSHPPQRARRRRSVTGAARTRQ